MYSAPFIFLFFFPLVLFRVTLFFFACSSYPSVGIFLFHFLRVIFLWGFLDLLACTFCSFSWLFTRFLRVYFASTVAFLPVFLLLFHDEIPLCFFCMHTTVTDFSFGPARCFSMNNNLFSWAFFSTDGVIKCSSNLFLVLRWYF